MLLVLVVKRKRIKMSMKVDHNNYYFLEYVCVDSCYSVSQTSKTKIKLFEIIIIQVQDGQE